MHIFCLQQAARVATWMLTVLLIFESPLCEYTNVLFSSPEFALFQSNGIQPIPEMDKNATAYFDTTRLMEAKMSIK